MTTTAPPAARPRATLWLLRATLTLHLLAVLAQPVLAGRYLAGDVDAIALHGALGSALAAVALVVAVGALAYVAAARTRLWLLAAAVVLFLAEGLQIGMGHARRLELHVPLGVAIVVASVLLAVWVWSPAAARGRGAR